MVEAEAVFVQVALELLTSTVVGSGQECLHIALCLVMYTFFFRTASERVLISLRQHRIMGQGDSARDFAPRESMENAGILDVFPIFHTARLG